ncbi:hypothetical protein [Halorhodospira abdelmalekii]|uniref:hypothetical protein n=1 Tax=Halorhodospira abdelmalekii TaxID=421629 RepID=UPI0019060D0C|nr:hypothetical protein [Halorhodospira abdelmalekii]
MAALSRASAVPRTLTLGRFVAGRSAAEAQAELWGHGLGASRGSHRAGALLPGRCVAGQQA